MGTLYIVGTPIGNLGDFSPRAIEILKTVDFIAAEDTRVTLKLLNHFEIRNTLISYHEHNAAARGPELLERLLNGENGAIVTDAGMPCISDPGEGLVALCHENEVEIATVPGPTAAMTALAASGLPTGKFLFEGFLPIKKGERRCPASGQPPAAYPHFLRSPPPPAPDPCRPAGGAGGSAHHPVPGADHAARRNAAHHPGGCRGGIRRAGTPRGICAYRGRGSSK